MSRTLKGVNVPQNVTSRTIVDVAHMVEKFALGKVENETLNMLGVGFNQQAILPNWLSLAIAHAATNGKLGMSLYQQAPDMAQDAMFAQSAKLTDVAVICQHLGNHPADHIRGMFAQVYRIAQGIHAWLPDNIVGLTEEQVLGHVPQVAPKPVQKRKPAQKRQNAKVAAEAAAEKTSE